MSTPERLTLVERMEQARLRTVAARDPGQSPAAPVSMAARHKPEPHAPARAVGPAWQPVGTPGQQLVLMPGQMHFGAKVSSLRTLLGSCVAITLWHPQKRIGGMCHYLLPKRSRKPGEPDDGRYGEEALAAMVEHIRRHNTDPKDYEAHLYGGADTMPEGTNLKFSVGERNIELGWSLIDRYGFQLQGVDVGEDVPRTVTLTVASGMVEMYRGAGKAGGVR